LCYPSFKLPILEGFDFDAGWLSQSDEADIRLIDFPANKNLPNIPQHHDECGSSPHVKNGGYRATELDIPRKDHAFNRRADCSVIQLFLRALDRRFGLRDRSLSLCYPCLSDGQ